MEGDDGVTDRERLLELAGATAKYAQGVNRLTQVILDKLETLFMAGEPAEEVFKELDEESQEWDNEGGQ